MRIAAVGTVCLIAAVLAFVALRRRRPIAVVGIAIAVVLLIGAYQSAESRARHLHWPPHRAPAVAAPPSGSQTNGYARLARVAAERIPSRSTYAVVSVRPQGAASWLRYALAPRIRTGPSQTRWVLVLGGTPAAAGITSRWSRQFGENWLVHT